MKGKQRHILITGGAGFIGSTLTELLLSEGHFVTAVDNFDPFYDEKLKRRNIRNIIEHPRYSLLEYDICNWDELRKIDGVFDTIVHIAAKAGVFASIKEPIACQQANVMGTQHMLELAKILSVKQFVFASSSSVYGVNPNVPWKESDPEMMPISPYASSKLSCEMLGHVYAHLHGIRFLALRFFTVYGPRQRPDLAINKFASKILKGEPIPVYGDGTTRRDYTYINDIISGVRAAMDYDKTDFEVINLGNHRTVSLSEMIETIEEVFGKKAIINRLPNQKGDVPQTYADISKANRLLGYNPQTTFKEGITHFRDWKLKVESPDHG